MSLSDKESFDNFLDYKDDVEYELSLKMSTDDMEYFEQAVLKELHTRNLVNYAFYKKQRETIKMVQGDQVQMSCLYILMVLMIVLALVLLVSNRDLLTMFLFINKDQIDKSLDMMKVKSGL